MSTLVYVGANVGSTLWGIFDKYDSVYVFEPDPEIYQKLKKLIKLFVSPKIQKKTYLNIIN